VEYMEREAEILSLPPLRHLTSESNVETQAQLSTVVSTPAGCRMQSGLRLDM